MPEDQQKFLNDLREMMVDVITVTTEPRFSEMDQKFSEMDQKFSEGFDKVEQNIKQDINDVRTELKQDIDNVRTELKQDINNVHTELKQDINNVYTELKQDISNIHILLENDYDKKFRTFEDERSLLFDKLHQAIAAKEAVDMLPLQFAELKKQVDPMLPRIIALESDVCILQQKVAY